MKIRLATPEIQKDSIVDGEGIRSVIWTQGCIHNCPGCHNPFTHSFDEGYLLDVEEVKEKIKELESQDGVTFSGGDPMEQPEACAELASYIKELGLNVWCYTGYTFEELLEKMKTNKAIKEFLKYVDVLVDGRFRIIDVKKSLKNKKAILVEKYESPKKEKEKKKLYV